MTIFRVFVKQKYEYMYLSLLLEGSVQMATHVYKRTAS